MPEMRWSEIGKTAECDFGPQSVGCESSGLSHRMCSRPGADVRRRSVWQVLNGRPPRRSCGASRRLGFHPNQRSLWLGFLARPGEPIGFGAPSRAPAQFRPNPAQPVGWDSIPTRRTP